MTSSRWRDTKGSKQPPKRHKNILHPSFSTCLDCPLRPVLNVKFRGEVQLLALRNPCNFSLVTHSWLASTIQKNVNVSSWSHFPCFRSASSITSRERNGPKQGNAWSRGTLGHAHNQPAEATLRASDRWFPPRPLNEPATLAPSRASKTPDWLTLARKKRAIEMARADDGVWMAWPFSAHVSLHGSSQSLGNPLQRRVGRDGS